MGLKHGIDASCYINIGIYATPAWAELDLFSNVTPNGGWDAADILIRRSHVKYGAKTVIDISFTGKMLCDDSDSNYQLLIASWQDINGTVDLLVLDGPVEVSGSFGYRADFQITAGGQDQPVDDVLYRDFEAKPFPTTNKPQWITCTGGGAFASVEI